MRLHTAHSLLYISFCNIIWGGASATNLERLAVLQKKGPETDPETIYTESLATGHRDSRTLCIMDIFEIHAMSHLCLQIFHGL